MYIVFSGAVSTSELFVSRKLKIQTLVTLQWGKKARLGPEQIWRFLKLSGFKPMILQHHGLVTILS